MISEKARKLYNAKGEVVSIYHPEDKGFTVESVQDVEPVAIANAKDRNHGVKRHHGFSMERVVSVPMVVLEKKAREMGLKGGYFPQAKEVQKEIVRRCLMDDGGDAWKTSDRKFKL